MESERKRNEKMGELKGVIDELRTTSSDEAKQRANALLDELLEDQQQKADVDDVKRVQRQMSAERREQLVEEMAGSNEGQVLFDLCDHLENDGGVLGTHGSVFDEYRVGEIVGARVRIGTRLYEIEVREL